ncbi:Serine-type D-Ala-D-Ala carboxypeptidase (plasmid) [Gloeocapsa sp. PCC 7428]|uniref:serine hydrolase domain-containing protein n=1 Tax=Gloeocapsa sp. PCC 7428 TaxID=1173026 RepID=UPI0002A5F02B|nr:serine hydrolase domain-containing protein [Gloeocapsa sp. PCC 7428]AFZ33404.1 Serine-type D-Ala-D-Ala carboxypeptidase [Gloeocapsa sp. PCC 7428]
MLINQSTFSSPRPLFEYLSQQKYWEEREASNPAPPVDDPTQLLQNTLDQIFTGVGISTAIVSDDIAWYGASGTANLTTNTPVTSSDRFQIGSITKTFVATTVLQLLEENQLSLEATLNQYLPSEIVSKISDSANITIRQLLNHTSGIPDYLSVLLDEGVNLFREWQPEALVEFIANQPLSFSPGTSWQYSNTNYILLGMIVENITNNSLATEIRTRILEPLQLDNTFVADTEAVPGGFVSGYWDINVDGNLDNTDFISPSIVDAAGAMVSNTEDLVDFAQALFGGDLLEPTTLDQMLTFVDAFNSRAFSGYGLGVARLNTPDELIYGHSGLTLGYRANMWYVPEDDLVYIDLQNTRTIDNFIDPLLTTWREYQADQPLLNDVRSLQFDTPIISTSESELVGVHFDSDLITLGQQEQFNTEPSNLLMSKNFFNKQFDDSTNPVQVCMPQII